MSKIYDKIYSFVFSLCKLMLLLKIIVVSYIVYGRFILNKTPAWGETLALMLMVWFSLLSTGLALKDEAHIRMSLVDLFAPEKVMRYLQKFYYVVILGFTIFMITAGYQLIQLSSLSVIPGLKIKSSYLFGAVFVSGIFIFVTILEKVRTEL
ncbi:TRAP transporter small permease [Desulfitibacter alkalitolerans]|uniref:TRAP transporter small permease n=1 Tax=Desulfitibacter alkalitolerans TaxID=264641 RepID=UPI0004813D6A|nr:TRAP transporter small permease subunit [Desulfitibacter alkalitolerans]